MSHTIDGQTTNYTWDPSAAAGVALRTGSAASLPVVLQDNTYTYVYGLDLISATDASGNQNYDMHNGQGSVANIVDYNGNEKARYLYDAFGNTRYQLELTPNVWKYTGEQQDDGTGFYYLRARYYDPFPGRFLGRDPVPGGNLYAYTENNPVNRIDPSGLCFGLGDCGPIDDVDNVLEDAYQAGDDILAVTADVWEFVAPYAVQCVSWGLSGAVIGAIEGGVGALPGAAIGCATGVLSQIVEDYAPEFAKPGLQCATWATGAIAATSGVLARGVSGGIACYTAVSSWVDSNYGTGTPAMQCLIWGTGAGLGLIAGGAATARRVTLAGLSGCGAGGVSDFLINGWSPNY